LSARDHYVYMSRQFATRLECKDLPLEHLEMPNQFTAALFKLIRMTVPLAYIYIFLLFLSELVYYIPEDSILAKAILMVAFKTKSSPFLATWAFLEGFFYIFFKLHLVYLQSKDPLECALKSAPFQTSEERDVLWNRLVRFTKSDPIAWITGWFFDAPIEKISHYDIMDFLTWSMFEGRSQEHLTEEEIRQLNGFLADLERILAEYFCVDEFHFHESRDNDERSSFTNLISHINRSAKAAREYFHVPDETSAYAHSLYENGLHALEHSRERFDFFSDEAMTYLHANGIQISNFIDQKTKHIRQQMESYKMLLQNARKMPINSSHMAKLLNEITLLCRKSHEMEQKAMETMKLHIKPLFRHKKPLRYAKYSSDPLVGIKTYPLSFHLLMLFCTDTLLRIFMKRRNFRRIQVGQITYYQFTPQEMIHRDSTPIVFCHGIGIGILPYLGFIDRLMKLNRPIFLPEIPFVTGFRAWQNINTDSVLPPHSVASNMVSMLANHGFTRATFVAHSYGTSWISYISKHAPHVLDSAVFLDPICFCLFIPFLTKQFVYHRPNPGSVSYIIRTDVHVHWTIQRCFPWHQVSLFVEDLPAKSSIFFSENDALVPKLNVYKYLSDEGAAMMDNTNFRVDLIHNNSLSATLLRDAGHGDFLESTELVDMVVKAVEAVHVGKKD